MLKGVENKNERESTNSPSVVMVIGGGERPRADCGRACVNTTAVGETILLEMVRLAKGDCDRSVEGESGREIGTSCCGGCGGCSGCDAVVFI